MNLKCRLWGHKIGDLNDSGYAICERCGMHEYYHNEHNYKLCNPPEKHHFDQAGLLMKPVWRLQRKIRELMKRFKKKFRYTKIHQYIYGWKYNELDDDLPF